MDLRTWTSSVISSFCASVIGKAATTQLSLVYQQIFIASFLFLYLICLSIESLNLSGYVEVVRKVANFDHALVFDFEHWFYDGVFNFKNLI